MAETASLINCDVLRIVLHHEAITKHQHEVFCLLLSSTKTVAAALAAHCIGHIKVSAIMDTVHDVTMFTAWLRKHGMLLKTLSLCMGHLSREQRTQAGTAIAVALQQAAGRSPSGLHIQHFSCPYPLQTMPAVVQQVPSRALTSLHIRCAGDPITDSSLGAVIAQLSSLQTLTIGRRFEGSANGKIDAVLRHLGGLTKLTALVVDTGSWVDNTIHLRDLPQQLKELSVPVFAEDNADMRDTFDSELRSRSLLLDHVTGLTQLVTDVPLSKYDLHLPTSLQQLTAADVTNAQPLQNLPQLRELSLLDVFEVTEDVVANLSLRTQLIGMSLKYELTQDAGVQDVESAAAWKHLPVVSLAIAGVKYGGLNLADQVLQQFSALTGLKHLSLHRVNVKIPDFCSRLLCFSALESVELSGFQRGVGDCDDAHCLMESLAALPNLCSLSVRGMRCDRAFAKLGAAAKLTSLMVKSSCIGGYSVNSILCRTKALASLELAGCRSVGDAVCPVIGMSRQLSKLVLTSTSITPEGAQELMSLPHIHDLFLLNTEGSSDFYEFSRRPG